MSDSVVFTKQEFLTELGRFRELFGTKTFWAKPGEERQLAIKGLIHVYFNLDPKVNTEFIGVAMDAALYEYGLRGSLMIKHGMEVGV